MPQRKIPNPFSTAKDRLGQDLIDIGDLDFVKVDLKYNGVDNFMKEDLYCGFKKAYLHQQAYQKFLAAGTYLTELKNNYKFLVFDALRPRSVQRKMFQFVSGTPMETYVAHPELGSMHNFGMAIDLTLIDDDENELDMGTKFDDFTEKAQPKLEPQLLKSGLLTALQIENRNILKTIMTRSGFEQLPHEWWHFNAFAGAFTSSFVRANFKIVE